MLAPTDIDVAGLQAKHSGDCALRGWTRSSDQAAECTCRNGPLYVVLHHGSVEDSETVALHGERDEDNGQLPADGGNGTDARHQPNIGFCERADRWLAALERKPSPVRS